MTSDLTAGGHESQIFFNFFNTIQLALPALRGGLLTTWLTPE